MSISFLFDDVPSCFNFICLFINLIIISILFCFLKIMPQVSQYIVVILAWSLTYIVSV